MATPTLRGTNGLHEPYQSEIHDTSALARAVYQPSPSQDGQSAIDALGRNFASDRANTYPYSDNKSQDQPYQPSSQRPTNYESSNGRPYNNSEYQSLRQIHRPDQPQSSSSVHDQRPAATAYVHVDPTHRPAQGRGRRGVVEISIAISFGNDRITRREYATSDRVAVRPVIRSTATIDDARYVGLNCSTNPASKIHVETDGIMHQSPSSNSGGFTNNDKH